MNNPPDISQDSKEYEEYAHGIRKHVRGYLMVGATLLVFTGVTVAHAKSEHRRGNAGRYIQSRAGGGNFHASRRRKTSDLPDPDFHRVFCAWPLLAYIFGVVRLPNLSLNVA
jgi:hypothetical protein